MDVSCRREVAMRQLFESADEYLMKRAHQFRDGYTGCLHGWALGRRKYSDFGRAQRLIPVEI
jgi:hypothetical protein